MRTLLNKLKRMPKVAYLTALVAAAAVMAPAMHASAFTGTYTGNGAPQFNIYKDVEDIGDESDFVRVAPTGSQDYQNTINSCDKDVDIWVYVHNGAPSAMNGANNDSSSVAKDVKLAVNLHAGTASSFTPEALVTASNAASVHDTAVINCGADYTMSFVDNSAKLFTNQRGLVDLDKAVVDGGTLIGSLKADGVVPGCWDFRNYIKLTVHFTKKTTPPVQSLTCDVLTPVQDSTNKRKFTFTAKGTPLNGATIVRYVFDFGDTQSQTVTTTDSTATAEHTYADDTAHNPRVTIVAKVNDKDTEVTSDQCVTAVSPTSTPPVTPPTTPKPTALPRTGAGNVLGMFAGVTIAGAVMYQFLVRRRALR